MKKITRKDFQGLRQHYPVLTKEEMHRYIGGYSDSYWNGDWFNKDSYFSDFAISTSGYGSGYEEFDGGYLPEVIIYGYYDSGYMLPEVTIYGEEPGKVNPDWYYYDPWGDDSYLGYHIDNGYPGFFDYGYYDDYGDGNWSGNTGGGGGGSSSNGNNNDGATSSLVDLNGTCVYDSLTQLMLYLQNDEVTENVLRQKYLEYLKSQKETQIDELFNGVKGKYIEGFAEYLGFEVKAMHCKDVIVEILDGVRNSVTGIAIVKIQRVNETGQLVDDYHAITVVGATTYRDNNGVVTGVSLTYEDKLGYYTDYIQSKNEEPLSEYEKTLLDPLDVLDYFDVNYSEK